MYFKCMLFPVTRKVNRGICFFLVIRDCNMKFIVIADEKISVKKALSFQQLSRMSLVCQSFA